MTLRRGFININQLKPKGGKRPGSGRKPHTIKGIMKKLPPDQSALILLKIDANSKWIERHGLRQLAKKEKVS